MESINNKPSFRLDSLEAPPLLRQAHVVKEVVVEKQGKGFSVKKIVQCDAQGKVVTHIGKILRSKL